MQERRVSHIVPTNSNDIVLQAMKSVDLSTKNTNTDSPTRMTIGTACATTVVFNGHTNIISESVCKYFIF